MALAVVKAEDGKKHLSLAFYLAAVSLVVLTANLLASAHIKP
jgi:hypothetical protein